MFSIRPFISPSKVGLNLVCALAVSVASVSVIADLWAVHGGHRHLEPGFGRRAPSVPLLGHDPAPGRRADKPPWSAGRGRVACHR